MEYTPIQKEILTLDRGKKMLFMDKVFIFTVMDKSFKDLYKMDLWKVKEFTIMKIAQLTTVADGIEEKNMEKELLTVNKKYIKEDGNKDKDMVKAITKINSQTKPSKDNLFMENDKVKENLFLLMEVSTKDNFKKIIPKEEVYSNMSTKIIMMDNFLKVKNKEKEVFFSVKEQDLTVNGKMIIKFKDNYYFSMEMFLKEFFKII